MKLTTNQIIACNIIDELIKARTQSKDDIILQLKSSEEFNNYCKSNEFTLCYIRYPYARLD